MKLALPALLLGAVGIGFAPIFVRVAGDAGVDPVASAFWRQAIAAPMLLIYMGVAGRLWQGWSGPIIGFTVAAGIFFAADMGLWHWSITLTSVANATLLANLNAVFVAVIGFLFFKERLRLPFWAGLAAAGGGAAFLLLGSATAAPARLAGDILGVATALMYTGYFITGRAARRTKDTASVLGLSTAVSALALGFCLPMIDGDLLPSSPMGWAPLAGLALISQVGGQGLILYAMGHLPAAFAALSLLLQPVVAALAAYWLFGETLGPMEWLGSALVLAGIILARWGSRAGHPPHAADRNAGTGPTRTAHPAA